MPRFSVPGRCHCQISSVNQCSSVPISFHFLSHNINAYIIFLIFTVHIFAFSRVAHYFNSLIGHSGVCVRVTVMYSSS